MWLQTSLLYLFLFLVLLSSSPLLAVDLVAASPLEAQKSALLQWKGTLQNPEILNSWNPIVFPCNWSGVACNLRQRAIKRINLYDKGLIGSINTLNFSALTSLRQLDLSFNQLRGAIPHSIGSLSSLIFLALAGNQISGSIPYSIGNLSSLSTLSLPE
ncbi:hypothetical protein KSP40_PGU002490 [Platanthera guangdongensis]|uniref:Leucine-rich repeat-containing N-terminal plant-type domain-containing protein n=1 Tax=Platanthera guangdongensis TaxID=2320717 RepID=A0ABR2M2Y6_9ASPA